MERLLELLAKAGDLTADEQAELSRLLADTLGTAETPAETLGDLSDEDLAAVVAAIPDAFDAARAAETPSIDLLTALADGIDAVLAEDQTRQAAAEEADRLVDDLARRVHASADDPENGDEGGDGDGDGDDNGEGGEGAGDAEAVAEPEVVTAAAPRPARPGRIPLSTLARGNTPAVAEAETPVDGARRITASTAMGGVPAGGEIANVDQLAELMADVFQRNRSAKAGQRIPLARFTHEYPEDRQLSPSDGRSNMERIGRVHESARLALARGQRDARYEGLVAAGGLCGPLPVRFDQDVVGSTDRPVAASLAGFDASRGGVRFVPSPTLADIGIDGQPGDSDAAIGIWTMANDEAADPTDAETFKSYQRIACGEEATAELYLITARFAVGNIQALTWPERVRAFIDLASVGYARAGDTALLARIQALSTAVAGFSPVLGSARDLLAEWASAAYALRTRNRVARETPVRVWAPEAARTSILIDLMRQLPGDDAYGRAATLLDRALGEIGVTVTWSPDLQVPGAVAGTLPQVPTTISYGIAIEGTFTMLDGLNIDLGFESNTPIRDTRTNAVNDYELFMEGGEQVAKFSGLQSLWVTTDVCPTGSTGGSVDVICDAS